MPTWRHLFHSRLPIMQAPLGGISNADLAIAVGESGGIGSIPCSFFSLDQLDEELRQMNGSGKAYVANFFCHEEVEVCERERENWRDFLLPYYREFGLDTSSLFHSPSSPSPPSFRRSFNEEQLSLLLTHRPPIISFHFGLPPPFLLLPLRSFSIILGTATTLKEAIYLERRGVDGVIVQGWEAGGHRGMFLSKDVSTQMGLFALLPRVRGDSFSFSFLFYSIFLSPSPTLEGCGGSEGTYHRRWWDSRL